MIYKHIQFIPGCIKGVGYRKASYLCLVNNTYYTESFKQGLTVGLTVAYKDSFFNKMKSDVRDSKRNSKNNGT